MRERCRGAFLSRFAARAVLAALFGAGIPAAAAGAEPAKTPAKGADAEAGPVSRKELREAREIFRAFQELAASASDAARAATASKGDPSQVLKQMSRPERSVTAPTLDAAGVDALLDKALRDAKTAPARLTSDEEFVRRVCLDVTGKLPTPEQVLTFLQNSKKDKRATLIDHLLDSPDYAANQARYWRDVIVFHATAPNPRLVNYPKLEEWLTDQFAQNTPWDEMAREMIVATGNNEEHGATVFALAQNAQPVELAGEVSRVFMGVQIQCAQCHDHPNDPWKREQFHEFASFFAGAQARRNGKPPKVTGLTLNLRGGTPRYTMPDLKDPQKSIPVDPKFFLASSESPVPKTLSAKERRILAASYVTGPDNPWFAKAFVNRAWAYLVGEGFYNPVDDIGPTREAHDPEVLEALAAQFQQGGYDVKWLFRTILNTRAYQREFRASNTSAGKVPFAANCPSRLRADQIFDALSQALRFPAPGAQNRQALRQEQKDQKKALPRGVQAGPRGQLNNLFGVDPSTPTEDVLGTIPQALFLMNSPQVNRAIRAEGGTVLAEVLRSTPNNRQAIEVLYLRVLARRPTAKELEVCDRYAMTVGDRKEVFEDILWSLINSTEFINRR